MSEESTPVVAAETPAVSEPAPTETPKPAEGPRKLKVKIDGKEAEIDEATAIRDYQLAQASHKRFKEAAEKEKRALDLQERFKADPFAVMRELGLDPRKMSEKHLAEALDEEMLTPEQKHLRDLENENKQLKETEKQREDRIKEEKVQALTKKTRAEYEAKMVDAISNSNLPKNATTVRRIAEVMYQAVNNGYDMSVEDAVSLVADDYHGGVNEFLGSISDAERLATVLGPEKLKMLRDWELSKVKNPAPVAKPASETPSKKPAPKKNMSREEFQANLRRVAEERFGK
jgi:uncharacterized protein with von Willebrand factor type A (vWA) domain